MSTRLLEAIVDIQHWLKHDIDEPCGSCIRFDELQLAAMELIKTSEARIAELEAEEQLFNKTFDAQQVIIEELRAENWRLRDALNAISHDAEDTEIVRMAVNALLGGGENG